MNYRSHLLPYNRQLLHVEKGRSSLFLSDPLQIYGLLVKDYMGRGNALLESLSQEFYLKLNTFL